MRMAETVDRHAAAKIQVAFAGDIKNLAARAVGQDQVKAPVAGHDVFREQFANGLKVVTHNRRGRGNNFFHLVAGNFYEVGVGVTKINRKNRPGRAGGLNGPAMPDDPSVRFSQGDDGSDTFVGEDFEHDGVGHATVHKGNFFDAGLDGGDGAVYFWNHALVHDAGGLERGNLAGLQM